MFRIKICGVTNAADARLAIEAGADAIGMNFYAGSPRHVAEVEALAVAAVVPAGVARVGVFVNDDTARIIALAERLQLDLIQLHGDEPAEVVSALAPRAVVRAFRIGPNGLSECSAYLKDCQSIGVMPAAVLVDAAVPGKYGGTGHPADWDGLGRPRDWLHGVPLVLAGGLTPENVGRAIDHVHPAAVDTASGVESAPGRKDGELVSRFVRAAREGFSRMSEP